MSCEGRFVLVPQRDQRKWAPSGSRKVCYLKLPAEQSVLGLRVILCPFHLAHHLLVKEASMGFCAALSNLGQICVACGQGVTMVLDRVLWKGPSFWDVLPPVQGTGLAKQVCFPCIGRRGSHLVGSTLQINGSSKITFAINIVIFQWELNCFYGCVRHFTF